MVSQERQSIGGRYKKGSEKHLYDMKPKQGTERNFRQSENGGLGQKEKETAKQHLSGRDVKKPAKTSYMKKEKMRKNN